MVEVLPERATETIRGAGGVMVVPVLKVRIPVALKVKVPILVGAELLAKVCQSVLATLVPATLGFTYALTKADGAVLEMVC